MDFPTPVPIPPNSGDPANFNSRADAFLGWMALFASWLNEAGYPELKGALPPLANLTPAANKMVFYTGASTAALTDLTAEARTLLASTLLSRSGNNLVTPAAARLTGGAVTQSITDMTVGRLLKSGDFGIGHAITLTAAMNLNDLTVSGQYYNPTASNSAGNNYPIAVAGSLHHLTDGSTARATQTFIAYGTAATYVRSKGAAGAWSAWTRLDVERGSNASGEYARFGDGTMICTWASAALTCETAAAGLYVSDLTTWIFPASFIVPPSVEGSSGQAIRWVGVSGSNTASVSFRALQMQMGSTATPVRLMAIGRWF